MKEVDYSSKRIAKNSILSFIYKVISMALSFASAPLLLNCLGEEKYGVWATLGSMISWIYYSDLGIGSGLRNKLSISLGKKDVKSARGYISVAYIILTGISVLLFLVAFIVLQFLDVSALLKFQVLDENINFCLIVALFVSCLNFVLSLVNNLAYAEQRASLVSFFNLLGQALFVGTLCIYSMIGLHFILYVALGEGICQAIKNIIETVYVLKKYPELKSKLSDAEKKYSKGILSFGLLVFVSQISSLIHNTTDNLLISYIFGAADVTPYNFCFKYFNLINTVYMVLLTPLVSAYSVAYAKKDYKWLKNAMKKSTFLYVAFFAGTIVAMFVFEPFASIWLAKSLNYENFLVLFCTVYFLMLMLSHNTTTLQTGLADLKMATVAVFIGSILNIPASIIFATTFDFGVTGIVIGSVVSMIPVLVVGIYKFAYYYRRM
ncbi:MAG: MATE family efflux transporter [Clostridia bacterium]|nr:MATE family efflux transporter [Clostridia bacterium]